MCAVRIEVFPALGRIGAVTIILWQKTDQKARFAGDFLTIRFGNGSAVFFPPQIYKFQKCIAKKRGM